MWYGDTNLALDGLAILTSPVLVGVGVYLAGPPIVHYQHGNTGRMLASIALRVGIPALAIASAANSAGSGDGENGMYGGGLLLIMGGVGALSAMLIDDLALSYARVPEAPRPAIATVVPGLTVDRRGMRASISGVF